MQATQCMPRLAEIHERLLRLEDIWNVNYSIKDYKAAFELTKSPQCGPVSPLNMLFQSFPEGPKSYLGEAWVNPSSGIIGTITKIELKEEILVRNVSNGLPCLIVVCSADINENIPAVLKFRLVEPKSETFTEMEGKNSLSVAFDSRLQRLFPKLYCMFDVTTLDQVDKNQIKWECIGMQPLADLSASDHADVSVLGQCARLISEIHRCGYAHGDSHLGNFMKVPDHDHDHHTPTKVLMIDQDEMKLLPTEPYEKAWSNYMQLVDYHTLLFHFNVYCNAFRNIKDDEDLERVCARLFRNEREFSLLFLPFPYSLRQNADSDDVMIELSSNSATKDSLTYLQYLGMLERSDIDRFFAELLQDTKRMRELNDLIVATHKQFTM